MPVLRSYRVRVHPNRTEEYEALERKEGLPMVLAMPGCLRAGFARVAEAHEPIYVFFSVWKDRESMEKALADERWKATSAKLAEQGLVEGRPIVEHWDFVASQDAR